MQKNMIEGIDCPVCGRQIPVDISFEGDIGNYIEHECSSISYDNGYPEISLCLKLDLEAIEADLEKLKTERKQLEVFFHHPVEKPKKLKLDADMTTSGNIGEKLVLNDDMTTTRKR